jgi:hydrogenase expression/formation protein HypE
VTTSIAAGPACPVLLTATDRVQLGHGSGGKMSAALLRDRFLPLLDNAALRHLGDAAVVPVDGGWVAMSTDTFVVSPIEFPGGNIGSLAVHGTLNDLVMMGARPRYLSVGFVLEEGLPFDTLDRVIASMASAAREAGVPVITGDTKVVERGRADGLYLNTTGIGEIDSVLRPHPAAVRPGDVLILSGPIARHGMAIMAAREGLAFEAQIESDSASLAPVVDLLRNDVAGAIRALRDPTRGGVASAPINAAPAVSTGNARSWITAAMQSPHTVSGSLPRFIRGARIVATVPRLLIEQTSDERPANVTPSSQFFGPPRLPGA